MEPVNHTSLNPSLLGGKQRFPSTTLRQQWARCGFGGIEGCVFQYFYRKLMAMNDLHEKKENDFDGSETTDGNRHETSRLYYKKLESYLLLLYQAYLQKETLLESEIKAAFWRMVQFREDFPMKIRMMQLELLSYETDNFNGEWNAVKDSLFPVKDDEVLGSMSTEREKQVQAYKDEVFELINHPS